MKMDSSGRSPATEATGKIVQSLGESKIRGSRERIDVAW